MSLQFEMITLVHYKIIMLEWTAYEITDINFYPPLISALWYYVTWKSICLAALLIFYAANHGIQEASSSVFTAA